MKTNHIITLVILCATASSLTSCTPSGNNTDREPTQTAPKEIAIDRNTTDDDIIRTLLTDWNNSLNNRDEHASQKVYADIVFYYTGDISGQECARLRVERASSDPTWHQEIITEPMITDLGGGKKSVEFTKQSDSSKGIHTHRAYLIVEKTGREWKITKESDAVTDKNVAKRKVSIPDDAIVGDFDGDGTTEHVWIEAKFDSEGYSTTPLRLRSDNPALGTYTWDKGLMGVILVNVGQLSGTGKDFLQAMPHGMSTWVTVQTLVSTDGEWKHAIPNFTAWTGNEEYLRVKPAGRPGYVTIIYNNMDDPDNGFENSYKQIPLTHQ